MKRIILTSIAILASIAAQAASITINGSRFEDIEPATNTGLKSVYVVEQLSLATIIYKADSDNVSIQRYSSLGGGFAEDVSNFSRDGRTYSFSAGNSDIGYIITDGSSQTCFWMVNYADYIFELNSIEIVSSDCDRVVLRPDVSAKSMNFYTINGRRVVIDREIKVKYYTLSFDETSMSYSQVPTEENIEYFDAEISVPAPLCDTDFEITPDRFGVKWGYGVEMLTDTYKATAVQAETSATQTIKENDNEQKVEAEMGGSAPCEVTFKAAITDAAIYHRWEISTYPEFDDIQLQFSDLEFTHTFTEAGMTYVRFVANNAEATCEFIGPTYTITIGDSRLECPNAFSPGTSEGVNDEWKVSYRSIVSFNCQIFNRWGQRMIELTDPSQGWDGRYNGKLVKSGTYFYVIQARGADNKKYDLSGHINVIGSRGAGSSSGDTGNEALPTE